MQAKPSGWKGFLLFTCFVLFFVSSLCLFDSITKKYIFLPKAQKICTEQYKGSIPWISTDSRRGFFEVPDFVECFKIDHTISPEIDIYFFSKYKMIDIVGVIMYNLFQLIFLIPSFWFANTFVFLYDDNGSEGVGENN